MKNKFSIIYEDKDGNLDTKLMRCSDLELNREVKRLKSLRLYIVGVFEGWPLSDLAEDYDDDPC